MAHSNLKLSWNSFFSQMSTNAMTTFTIAIATQIVKILKARIIVLADQDTLATDLIANQKRLLLPLLPRPPPADAEAAAAGHGVENWLIMSDQPRISTCRRRTLASFSVFFLFLIVPLDALCKAFLAIFRSPNEKKRRKTRHSIRIQRPIGARGANQFLFHRREKLQFIMWIWR